MAQNAHIKKLGKNIHFSDFGRKAEAKLKEFAEVLFISLFWQPKYFTAPTGR